MQAMFLGSLDRLQTHLRPALHSVAIADPPLSVSGGSFGIPRRANAAPTQDLVCRQRQDPKHQMGHDFPPSANSHKGAPVFVFQPTVDALDRRAFPHASALARTAPAMFL